jgi:DNA-directed RNA polymerase subunit RPC12/RpoP
MRFEIHSDSVAIRCGRCAKKILGKGGNKQAKRAECQENLLRHMCHKHEE